jgi:uncharacterized protein YhjY with autotransporter beta-barrel domain/phospholipase/lecithinase/hemolysin
MLVSNPRPTYHHEIGRAERPAGEGKMSMFRKIVACSMAGVAAMALAAPASAQRVNRIVAFGDSYADDGNLFELLGIPRPAVYPNGRFSDRTNFVDTMAALLAVPVDNFAIGGAFTNNGNINGPGIPGFTTEYQSFLAGGGPAAFPRVTGKFNPQDLLVLSIGGNDARAYEKSLGVTPTAAQISGLIAGAPAQAAARVAEATTGINALVGAGARNITFLAGDVGRLPEVAGLPVAQVGSAYAAAFNAGIQSSLSKIAGGGVIVNYLDLNLIGDRVQNNLAAFGMQSAGACPIACVTTNPELLSRYLFYVDQVHLTSAGFEIVGRYAVRQLEAPLHLEAQAAAGLQGATAFGRTLQARASLSDARGGGESEGRPLRFFVAGNFAKSEQVGTLTSLAHDLDTGGVTAGVEYDRAGFLIGGAVNLSQSKAELGGSGEAKANAKQAGFYAAWSGGGAFVQAHAGIGRLDYKIRRQAVIDDISASPDGNTVNAGARLGFLAGFGGLRVGPVAGLHYAKVNIDDYVESGDPVLTNSVSGQETSTLLGEAGLEARGDFEFGAAAMQPFLSATLEREFQGDARTIRYAGTASPTIVNSWQMPERSNNTYGRVTGGVSIGVTGAIAVQLLGSATLERDGGNEKSGSLALRVGF